MDESTTVIMVLLAVVTWFLLAWAIGRYAEKKGRSGMGVALASLFLTPLIGFLIAVGMEPDEKKIATMKAAGKKQCPDCAEWVQPAAKICRFCQHKFE
jgi:phosphate/sulfate permease